MSTKKILKQIARNNNVSVKQLEKDMREAIRAAMLCHPAEANSMWNELSPDGKEPSIDAFLRFCTRKVIKQ